MDRCIPVHGQRVSPPCPLAISRADSIRCSSQMQSYTCLCVPKVLFPSEPGAVEHVTWDADSRRVCRSQSRLRKTCWAMWYPSSFCTKHLRYFQYFLFTPGLYDGGKRWELGCLFKKRLRIMRHNKMNCLEKITECASLQKSLYIKNM